MSDPDADAALAQAQAQLGHALQHAHDSLRVMRRASQGLDVLATQLPPRRLRRSDRLSGDGPPGLRGAASHAGPTPGVVGTLAPATLPRFDPAAQVRIVASSLREQGMRLEQALAALEAESAPAVSPQAAGPLAPEVDSSVSRRLAAAALRSAAEPSLRPEPPAPPAGEPRGDKGR